MVCPMWLANLPNMKREIRIPLALKIAAMVWKLKEEDLAERVLARVTGAQAFEVAKAIKAGGGK